MKRIIGLIALLVISTAACAQQQSEAKENTRYKSTDVGAGIVMLEGEGEFVGGNLALSSGPDGVILIDNGMEPFYPLMKAAIEAAVGQPVDFVVNTHLHGDHTGNNANLHSSGARIIAHDKLRSRMKEAGKKDADGNPIPTPQAMLPELTFSTDFTMHLNGQRTHLIHVANAHTDGDSIVHFIDANVIHAGDIFFNGLYPFIDLNSGGSVDGYIAAIDTILALSNDQTKIIPGHGPLASKTNLEALRKVVVTGRDRVRSLVSAGSDLDAIKKADPLSEYNEKWAWQFITTERMLETLFNDANK